MASITNYYGLKADILVKVEDQSDEVLTALDEIIAGAEDQCIRDLDLDIFEDEFAAGTLTINQRVFTPAGVLKINHVWITQPAGTVRSFIRKRTKSFCESWAPDSAIQAQPTYWAPSGGSTNTPTMVFYDAPDKAYPVVMDGIKRPPGLSDSNQTTWLSLYAADLLLYACLTNCEEYLSNPQQSAIWKADYQDRLLKAKTELRGMARSTYEAARAAGQATNPL